MGARLARHAKAAVVVCAAVIAAVTGTALAGPDAQSSGLTKSKVKKIVRQQVAQLAPTLHVASADRATRADSATSADTARSAETATSAATATTAETAKNAEALGGKAAAGFGSGIVFGSAANLPAGTSGQTRPAFGISTVVSDVPAVTPFAVTFRDFEAVGFGVSGDDVVQISVDTSAGSFLHPLCTLNGSAPECDAPAGFTVPDDIEYVLIVSAENLEGGERVDFGYRLVP
jgi:hypothetical protein